MAGYGADLEMPPRGRDAASCDARRHRVIVLEQQRVVALDIAQAFEAAGAEVVGIASTVECAIALIAAAGVVDGAILDLDFRIEATCLVADELKRRGIPFVLLTGMAAEEMPDRFADAQRCHKPFNVDGMVALLLPGNGEMRGDNRASLTSRNGASYRL
ncbi:response regulator [Paracoccus tibetensis]|uniref:response regulator n=1 Tax=Paracoccus tibetensis TaxID=336292 RepID=UPI000B181FA3|nr:response regulator [Paracoccus tibetensis]